MLTNSKIALSVALVLATASAAIAAPKHAVSHQTTVARQVPAGAYLSFARHQGTDLGAARASGSVNESLRENPGYRQRRGRRCQAKVLQLPALVMVTAQVPVETVANAPRLLGAASRPRVAYQ